ncbi:hypothetical protein NP590_19760 [Methylomonas sp. SURF-2]|uniref:Cytochrome C n=1 Tax=Methylomonas subterranea TaxID=2952225 RepID=A0ABT1TLL3_9GAMM|nr:hypothetical protein [Methylomonas sp. SURF-2]MCQ8106350.1 hypothetical protein [Methylomonas sp. SURF-2]
MRKANLLLVFACLLISGAVAAEADFDFEELMNDVETKIQNVQNNIAAQDVATATTETKELLDAFKLVEGYFSKRGDAEDAVHNSREYQTMAGNILSALSTNDLNSAGTAANEFSKQCRGVCHDKYKPL